MSMVIIHDEINRVVKFKLGSLSYCCDINDFINPQGNGTFGIVYKAYKDNDKSQIVAIKKIRMPEKKAEKIKVKQEILIMKELGQFNNIAKIIETGEDDNHLYIAMKFYDKDSLSTVIHTLQSEQQVIQIFRQICNGVLKMHQIGYIHRDLKAENILAEASNSSNCPYNMAIADFGLSKICSYNMTVGVGTKETSAPEVSTNVYDKRADIYSLGCILYRMLAGCNPFDGDDEPSITKLKNAQSLKIASKFSLSTISLILLEGCLQYDMKNRILNDDLMKLLDLGNLWKYDDNLWLGLSENYNELHLKEKYFEKQLIPKKLQSLSHNMEEITKLLLKYKINIAQLIERISKIKSLASITNGIKSCIHKLEEEEKKIVDMTIQNTKLYNSRTSTSENISNTILYIQNCGQIEERAKNIKMDISNTSDDISSIERFQDDFIKAQTNLDAAVKEVTTERKEKERLNREIQTINEQMKKDKDQYNKSIEKLNNELIAYKNNAEKEIIKYTEQITLNKANFDKLNAENTSYKESANKQITDLVQQLASMTRQYQTANSTNTNLQSECNLLHTNEKKISIEILQSENNIRNLSSELSSLTDLKNSLTAENSSLKNSLAELNINMSSIIKENEDQLIVQIEKLNKIKQNIISNATDKRTIQSLRDEVLSLSNSMNTIKQYNGGQEKLINTLKAEYIGLKEDINKIINCLNDSSNEDTTLIKTEAQNKTYLENMKKMIINAKRLLSDANKKLEKVPS